VFSHFLNDRETLRTAQFRFVAGRPAAIAVAKVGRHERPVRLNDRRCDAHRGVTSLWLVSKQRRVTSVDKEVLSPPAESARRFDEDLRLEPRQLWRGAAVVPQLLAEARACPQASL